MEGDCSKEQLSELNSILGGVCAARDLVNEPLSYLTAPQLSKEIERLGQEAGFTSKIS